MNAIFRGRPPIMCAIGATVLLFVELEVPFYLSMCSNSRRVLDTR